jgi:hypothetical protein
LNEFHEFPFSFRLIWALVRFLILFALFLDGESGALRSMTLWGHKNAMLLLNKYFGRLFGPVDGNGRPIATTVVPMIVCR